MNPKGQQVSYSTHIFVHYPTHISIHIYLKILFPWNTHHQHKFGIIYVRKIEKINKRRDRGAAGDGLDSGVVAVAPGAEPTGTVGGRGS
jgi:hypothetical protein